MANQSEDQGQMMPTETETPAEVVACMDAFLKPVAKFKKRWSNRVIALALTTHACASVQALLKSGEYTEADADWLCRDFRDRVMTSVDKRKQKKSVAQSN